MKTHDQSINKRQKECFTANEIAHIWAHQSYPHGRVSGGNKSFHGVEFFSYSTVIATIINYRGKKAYVIDNYKFSVTTTCHQSEVSSAIPAGEHKFYVTLGKRCQSMSFTPQSLLLHYWTLYENYDINYVAPKLAFKRDCDVLERVHYLESAIAVAEYFGLACAKLKRKLAKHADEIASARKLLEQRQAKLKLASEQREITQRKNKIARNMANATAALALPDDGFSRAWIDSQYLEGETLALYNARVEKIEAEKITSWINGENVHLSRDLPLYLRLEGNEVVTSKGARFSLDDGKRAFEFAMKMREKGWHKNGEQFAIGHYHLDSINEFGVVAGCHRVSWLEIERFAKLQNWV